jgi:hypothetical protein
MMKSLNNKGIALITALMFTMIIMVIIMGIMTLISDNAKRSAAQKTYRNVIEASYGGADIVMQDILPRLFSNISTSIIRADYSMLNMQLGSSACLRQKMLNSTDGWTACSAVNIDPKSQPDMTFNLSGESGKSTTNFKVYAKIVDTTPGVPFPPQPAGGPLLGGGVTDSSAGTTLSLQHYVYRVEVAGERSINPAEKSNLSVLYEY